MDFGEIVFASVFILWMLKIALKPRVSPTVDDWLGLFRATRFLNRKKTYFREKYFE